MIDGHAHTDDDKLPFSADEWKELQDLKPKYPETNIFSRPYNVSIDPNQDVLGTGKIEVRITRP